MRTSLMILPLALFYVSLTGCDVVGNALNIKLPTAGLNRVDLLRAPSSKQVASWACYEWLGNSTCSLVGLNKPSSSAMQFSFDLVFDLRNPNAKLPIPLVEMLLGLRVFQDQNLGATCVSFCDPEKESCTPEIDAEGACQADAADDVQGAEDLIPSVDDLVDLAEEVVSGDTSNWGWRTLKPKSSLEAHIQFDLNSSITFGLAENVLTDAANDLLRGRSVSVDVPYTAEGTLFFDIPKSGRRGVGFGPFDDTWKLQ